MKRYWSYLKYVMRHKWFVFWACIDLRVPIWLALLHDSSKFSRAEWSIYANVFFDSDGAKSDLRKTTGYDPNNSGAVTSFSYAWIHHQQNKHHWQAWVSIGDEGNLKPVSIPEIFLREMIADWIGAGLAISGKATPHEWYQANKMKMILHPQTSKTIERLLDELPEL